MEAWKEDLRTQIGELEPPSTKWAEYTVLPAVKVETDSQTRRPTRYRFSCAGFVRECYRVGAGISLIREPLPLVSLDLLEQIYEQSLSPQHLVAAGLHGEGPWRVLLPGYLLHALASATPRDPQAPRLSEASYP